MPEESDPPEEWTPEDLGAESTIPDTDNDKYDMLINSEVVLPNRDKNMYAVVVRRHRDEHGNMVGLQDKNSILNTAIYDVQFPNGAMK